MTTDLADTASEQYKRCPQCHYATPAELNRCQHCLASVTNAEILHPDAAQRSLERQAEEEAEIAARQRRRDRIRRGVTLAIVAVVVVWTGWQLYRTFIWDPGPVPLPASTERQMAAVPDAWPTTGGDARAARATDAPAALDRPEAWRTDLAAMPATRLVADADRLYVTLEDNRLVALDLTSGDTAWEASLPVTPIATPTVAGDRVYIALPAGQLIAFEAATGDEVFASEITGSRFISSPIVVDGAAYTFGVGDLVVFDAGTGDVLWNRPVDSTWATLSPVVAEESVALASGDRSLVYSRETSRETYFYEFNRAHPYAIAADGDIVYTASSRFIAAYHIDSRRPWWEGVRAVWLQFEIWMLAPSVPPPPSLWTQRFPPEDGYPLALGDDRLYLANRFGDLRAYDRTTGEPAWEVTTAGTIVAPPILAADGLLIVHPDRLATYEPGTGDLVTERPVTSANLQDAIVTTAGLFAVTRDGHVIAFGSSTGR